MNEKSGQHKSVDCYEGKTSQDDEIPCGGNGDQKCWMAYTVTALTLFRALALALAPARISRD